MAKKGRLSAQERGFILGNMGAMTPDDIAAALDRTADMVREVIAKHTGADAQTAPAEHLEVRKTFRNTAEWTELRKQFTADEMAYFEERYATWVSQLKDDMTPSEQTQIFLLLKTEILINRNLADKQTCLADIGRIEKMVESTLRNAVDEEDLSDSDKQLVRDFNDQLAAMRGAQAARTAEFIKLTDTHAGYMRAMKATRDQRKKNVENIKVGFVDIIKELMTEEGREQNAEYMELMKAAALKERERLGSLHTYADGGVDRPILDAETVLLDEQDAS